MNEGEFEMIWKEALWLNRCTLLEFSWRNARKASVRRADVPVDIRTEHKSRALLLDQPVRSTD
jgi:hypothetical protein